MALTRLTHVCCYRFRPNKNLMHGDGFVISFPNSWVSFVPMFVTSNRPHCWDLPPKILGLFVCDQTSKYFSWNHKSWHFRLKNEIFYPVVRKEQFRSDRCLYFLKLWARELPRLSQPWMSFPICWLIARLTPQQKPIGMINGMPNRSIFVPNHAMYIVMVFNLAMINYNSPSFTKNMLNYIWNFKTTASWELTHHFSNLQVMAAQERPNSAGTPTDPRERRPSWATAANGGDRHETYRARVG